MLNKKIAGAPWCCLSASAWFSSVKLLFVVLILMPTLIHASPQSQPTLQIISPTPKTVVNPGQTVTVSVTSPTPGAFSGVELTGDDPLGFVGTVSVLPAQIPVTIPLSRIDCGSYFLTVSGTPTSGQGPVSAIVELDVERSDFPLTISAALSPIIFDSAGEQIRLDLLAGFADGTTFSVNASSYVTYSSSNTAVATVDSTGLVKAVGPGSGSVTVTYALGSNNNEIFVPVSVPCVSGLSGRGTPSGQAPAKIDVTWTENTDRCFLQRSPRHGHRRTLHFVGERSVASLFGHERSRKRRHVRLRCPAHQFRRWSDLPIKRSRDCNPQPTSPTRTSVVARIKPLESR